jgi:hypothetical protein
MRNQGPGETRVRREGEGMRVAVRGGQAVGVRPQPHKGARAVRRRYGRVRTHLAPTNRRGHRHHVASPVIPAHTHTYQAGCVCGRPPVGWGGRTLGRPASRGRGLCESRRPQPQLSAGGRRRW